MKWPRYVGFVILMLLVTVVFVAAAAKIGIFYAIALAFGIAGAAYIGAWVFHRFVQSAERTEDEKPDEPASSLALSRAIPAKPPTGFSFARLLSAFFGGRINKVYWITFTIGLAYIPLWLLTLATRAHSLTDGALITIGFAAFAYAAYVWWIIPGKGQGKVPTNSIGVLTILDTRFSQVKEDRWAYPIRWASTWFMPDVVREGDHFVPWPYGLIPLSLEPKTKNLELKAQTPDWVPHVIPAEYRYMVSQKHPGAFIDNGKFEGVESIFDGIAQTALIPLIQREGQKPENADQLQGMVDELQNELIEAIAVGAGVKMLTREEMNLSDEQKNALIAHRTQELQERIRGRQPVEIPGFGIMLLYVLVQKPISGDEEFRKDAQQPARELKQRDALLAEAETNVLAFRRTFGIPPDQLIDIANPVHRQLLLRQQDNQLLKEDVRGLHRVEIVGEGGGLTAGLAAALLPLADTLRGGSQQGSGQEGSPESSTLEPKPVPPSSKKRKGPRRRKGGR